MTKKKVTVQGKGKKHLEEGLRTWFGIRVQDSSTACKTAIFPFIILSFIVLIL